MQGQITVVSEQGLFINLGSTAALVTGQSIKLLGQAESIMEPETEKVLAAFRPTLATLLVSQVMNGDLSKVTLNSPESSVSIERGMVLECERLPRTVVLIPPQWESGEPLYHLLGSHPATTGRRPATGNVGPIPDFRPIHAPKTS